MASPLEGLRKVLALERAKKYNDAAVVGGIDSYLLKFAQDNGVEISHPISRVLQSLPPGGYRVLHPIQRARVVEQLLTAAENGPSVGGKQGPPPQEPAQPPAKIMQFPQKKSPAPRAKTPRKAPAKSETSATEIQAPVGAIGTIDAPLTALGIKRGDAEKFRKLDVATVRDLLFHFPSRYHDYSEVRPISDLQFGEEQTVIGTVFAAGSKTIGRYRRGTEAILSDASGTLRVIWWGQTYVARRLKQGMKVALSGKVTEFRGRMQMENPELEPLEDESLHTRRLVPVYPSTEGLFQKTLRTATRVAVDAYGDMLEDSLPAALRRKHDLMPAPEAIRQVHFPDDLETAERARARFGFEELLYIELGVVRRRKEWQDVGGAPVLALPSAKLEAFLESLPFTLTKAQRAAIDDVLQDTGDETPMTRLLEGDVGSGKTVVAAAALLAAVASGYQGAIMAPTEILAEQHMRTFTRILQPERPDDGPKGPWFQAEGPGYVVLDTPYMDAPVRVALLTGSLKAAEKTAVQAAIASGEVDIAIGTHALLQEGVSFQRLGLAVIDEQHRFGVEQRATLREKGGSPHVLVMTATPIPRTLALTLYGDLDITVLNEMPPGRPAVKTWRVLPYRRSEAFEFVEKKLLEGRQAYVICPLVEESASVEAKAAVQEYERLRRDVFPDRNLGLLHGRMSATEKESVMRQFRDGEVDILVSTAVVEVGVDVPNATVILIEGADRFGLSQLHQFRGRVRRSEEQAYCFLLSDNPSPESEERLAIMETVDNGFELAEHDLRLRGPGEYFGTRQSGLPDLRIAKLTDIETIQATRAEATRMLEEDPELERPEHAKLAKAVRKLWDRISSDVS
ncbi:MAG: ATP-dependent DNA helicase RecG [Chloroflexota bacterium]